MGKRGWQFHVDGRQAGPVRATWLEAAGDAVRDVYADWANDEQTSVRWDNSGGGSVETVKIKPKDPANV